MSARQHPAPRSRRRSALSVGLAVVALVLAGCSAAQRAPTSYTVSVQRNFVRGCETAGAGDGMRAPRPFCTCVYAAMRKTIPFAEFRKVNSLLTDQGGPLPAEIQSVVDKCRS